MIVGAVFVPATPLLVPQVAQGAAAELADLTHACRSAIGRFAGRPVRWVLIGSGPRPERFDAGAVGTLAGFGVPLEVPLGGPGEGLPPRLPPSLTVGAWLLQDAAGPVDDVDALSVNHEGNGPALEVDDRETVLLVVGDGSACRSEKAPGYFDERAGAFDAAVAEALGTGVPEPLGALDGRLSADLLCAGLPAWRAAARVLGGRSFGSELLYDAAPYGVGYFVAVWTDGG